MGQNHAEEPNCTSCLTDTGFAAQISHYMSGYFGLNYVKIVRRGHRTYITAPDTNWALPPLKEIHMSRIRVKTAVAALLITVTAVGATAPVIGSVDAGGKPSRAILRAIL